MNHLKVPLFGVDVQVNNGLTFHCDDGPGCSPDQEGTAIHGYWVPHGIRGTIQSTDVLSVAAKNPHVTTVSQRYQYIGASGEQPVGYIEADTMREAQGILAALGIGGSFTGQFQIRVGNEWMDAGVERPRRMP